MAGSCTTKTPIIFTLVSFLFLFLSSSSSPPPSSSSNRTLWPTRDFRRLKRVRALVNKINKPFVKTFQSPEGDVIDCVLSHLQPAFDHPLLIGQKPLEPPERPKALRESVSENQESFQVWMNHERVCPQGTIPIRRTTEGEVLRASSVPKFGRKITSAVRRDTTSSDHEHAVAITNGDQYYGAKASINVWTPVVSDRHEFSLSQIWVISGSFGNDLNTIEAGWQTDAYQATGCYNLLCSGFVQTNNRIAMGAVISPRSSYDGKQFDITITIWKDPKHGNWWLEFGSGVLVGYWPAVLFTHLRSHASMVQYGGEVVNTGSTGYHTLTQMGSGHFADEGYGKASYMRNLEVVDWDNNLMPPSDLRLSADHPGCYDVKSGTSDGWGDYIYYGGPGRNSRCP